MPDEALKSKCLTPSREMESFFSLCLYSALYIVSFPFVLYFPIVTLFCTRLDAITLCRDAHLVLRGCTSRNAGMHI